MPDEIAFDDLVSTLKAISEPTRLRLLRVLARAELTVTELTQVLGQSQPRVSHHLRTLMSAGILERIQEGTWAFYRLQEDHRKTLLVRTILESMASGPQTARDSKRLDGLKRSHAEEAERYFQSMATRWDDVRKLYVAEERVEEAMLELAGPGPFERFLDLGTGTGRILEMFAPHSLNATGIDSNREMLSAARAKLSRRGFSHCQFRLGDILALQIPAESYDLVTIHHVLHFLDDPAVAVAEAARALRVGGRILVVDFARHQLEFLREQHAHRRLGFDGVEVARWLGEAGVGDVRIRHLETTRADVESTDSLTVTIWSGNRYRSSDEQRHEAA